MIDICEIMYDIIRDRRVGLPKIYTKGGDEGETGLLYGGRVSKSDPRCEAYGAVDEAVSALGLARALVKTDKLKSLIWGMQRDLFTVGAELATDRSYYGTFKKHFNVITPDDLLQKKNPGIFEQKSHIENRIFFARKLCFLAVRND